jgi:hypothetical protein
MKFSNYGLSLLLLSVMIDWAIISILSLSTVPRAEAPACGPINNPNAGNGDHLEKH